MIVTILSVITGIALGLAFYKHHTLSAVVASAKKEVIYLESVAVKVSTDVQSAYTASIARLKALL